MNQTDKKGKTNIILFASPPLNFCTSALYSLLLYDMNRMYVKKYLVMFIGLFTFTMLPLSYPSAADFVEWLAVLKAEAMAKGISEATLETAFAKVQPIQRIIKLDRNQPEFKKDYWSYIKMTVTESRIKKARRLLIKHRLLLEDIKNRYGVQPRFLVAIWGMETNFGTHPGNFPVIASLATLAYDTRRSIFFRAELLNALKILDEGHIDVSDMQGSWAGAMGQLQFMPSTFINFAVDADKDGRKDIWHSLPDVFASAANYLSKYNWQGNRTWGREVRLPLNFNRKLVGLETKKPLSEWQNLGIRRLTGRNLPEVDIDASLILPSGSNGPAFLVYRNYRAIYRWNPSHLYTLAVCRLSDRLVE
ncbi:membrane-bound lytic murein transglycosylase B precursor [bacterium BMS3Abin06]|nr:membrane-bound lytic murein transglycosylase B precursor [bacterium BMS3Abin06]